MCINFNLDANLQQTVPFSVIQLCFTYDFRMTPTLLVFGIAVILSKVSAHSYHWGDCPHVEPAKNFDMTKVRY